MINKGVEGSDLFKPATSKNDNWNLVKTLLQTAVFWSVFLYILPKCILRLEEIFGLSGFSAPPVLGWILFAFFSCVGLASGYTMSWFGKGTPLPIDCPNQLVIKGPYKWVRNPMAVAGIGQGVSVGIISDSYFIIFYALAGAILWHFSVRPIEERDLENRFGIAYLNYKAKTRCWIPSIN